MGVLHVGGRVAVHGQHFVVVEDVVAGAVLRKIGVFERADADRFGDFLTLFGRKLRAVRFGIVVVADDRQRPADAFVEQTFQADGIAGTGFERLAVVAQHGAEADVLEFDIGPVGMPQPRGGEQVLEVQALAMIDDVQNRVGLPRFHAVLNRGQIGRGVQKRAVFFANQQRGFVTFEKDANGAFAFPGDFFCQQIIDDAGQTIVVKTFAQLFVER